MASGSIDIPCAALETSGERRKASDQLCAKYHEDLKSRGITHPALDDLVANRETELEEEGTQVEDDYEYQEMLDLCRLRSQVWESALENPESAITFYSAELTTYLKERNLRETISAKDLIADLQRTEEEYEEDPRQDNKLDIHHLKRAIVCAKELEQLIFALEQRQIQGKIRLLRANVPISTLIAQLIIPDTLAELRVALDEQKRLLEIRKRHLENARKAIPLNKIDIERREKIVDETLANIEFLQKLIELEERLVPDEPLDQSPKDKPEDEPEQFLETIPHPVSFPSEQSATSGSVPLKPPKSPRDQAASSSSSSSQSSAASSSSASSSDSPKPSHHVVWLPSTQSTRHNHEVPTEEILIQALLQRLHGMSSCIEKNLWLLYCRSALLVEGAVPQAELQQFETDTQALWNELRGQFHTAVDRFILSNARVTPDEVVRKLSGPLSARQWPQAKQAILEVCQRFTPFNLHEAMFLIERSKNAGQLGGSIVLLTGPTGCGKSTTVHYLAGSSFEAVNLDPETLQEVPASNKNSLLHFKPVPREGSPVDVSSFVSSAEMKSETRYVNTVHLRCQVDGRRDVEFTLADTAGFGDTRGAELEMANTAGLVCALHAAKDCRLLVLIRMDSLDSRLGGLIRLFDTLASMFKNIEDALPSVMYVLTGFKKSEGLDRFIAKAENARKHLLDQNHLSEHLKLFFDDLLEKANMRRAFLVDPRHPEPADLLLKIDAIPRIRHPDEVFRFFSAPVIDRALGGQLVLEQQRIVTVLESGAPESIDYAYFKLKLLTSFAELVPTAEIDRGLSNIVESVKAFISGLKNQARELLENAVRKEKIDPNDLAAFRGKADRASEVETKLQEFLSGIRSPDPFSHPHPHSAPHSAPVHPELIETAKKLAAEIVLALDTEKDTGQSTDAQFFQLPKQIQCRISNLAFFVNEFPSLEELFETIKTPLSAFYEARNRALIEFLQADKPGDFIHGISQLYAAALPHQLQTVVQASQEVTISALAAELREIDLLVEGFRPRIFQTDCVSEETVVLTIKASRLLHALQSGYTATLIRPFISSLPWQDVSTRFTNTIQNYFANLTASMAQRLKDQDKLALDSIRKPFLILKMACESILLVNLTTVFGEACQGITHFFTQIGEHVKENIRKSLQVSGQDSSNWDVSPVHDLDFLEKIELLREPSWTDTGVPTGTGGRAAAYAGVVRLVLRFIQSTSQRLDDWRQFLTIQDSSKLATCLEYSAKLVELTALFPDVEQQRDAMCAKLHGIVSQQMDLISNIVPLSNKPTIHEQIQWLEAKKSAYDQMSLADKITELAKIRDRQVGLEQNLSRIRAQFDEAKRLRNNGQMSEAASQSTQTKHDIQQLRSEEEACFQVILQFLAVLKDASAERPELLPEASIECLSSTLSRLKGEFTEVEKFVLIDVQRLNGCTSYLQILKNCRSFPGPMCSLQPEIQRIATNFSKQLANYTKRFNERIDPLFNQALRLDATETERGTAASELSRLLNHLHLIEKAVVSYFETMESTCRLTLFAARQEQLSKAAMDFRLKSMEVYDETLAKYQQLARILAEHLDKFCNGAFHELHMQHLTYNSPRQHSIGLLSRRR